MDKTVLGIVLCIKLTNKDAPEDIRQFASLPTEEYDHFSDKYTQALGHPNGIQRAGESTLSEIVSDLPYLSILLVFSNI